jgi:hypothetical protein
MLLYNEQACQMPYSKLEPLLRQLGPGKKGDDKVVKKKKSFVQKDFDRILKLIVNGRSK